MTAIPCQHPKPLTIGVSLSGDQNLYWCSACGSIKEANAPDSGVWKPPQTGAPTEEPAPHASPQLEWLRRERLDGDPLWTSAIGELSLIVNVPIGCPWAWEWSVEDENGIDLARGDLMLDEPDDGTEWNYQGVINAERRCEGVARALLVEIPAAKYVGTCIHIEQPFGEIDEEHPERTCLRCQAKSETESAQVTETSQPDT